MTANIGTSFASLTRNNEFEKFIQNNKYTYFFLYRYTNMRKNISRKSSYRHIEMKKKKKKNYTEKKVVTGI